ncbi:hypothetical protein D3C77_519010 [compost metagenome]
MRRAGGQVAVGVELGGGDAVTDDIVGKDQMSNIHSTWCGAVDFDIPGGVAEVFILAGEGLANIGERVNALRQQLGLGHDQFDVRFGQVAVEYLVLGPVVGAVPEQLQCA